MSGVTWQDVARVLVARWPSGPANRGWDTEQVDAIMAELRASVLTPQWAIVALRDSGSAHVPSVAEIGELAWHAMGPTGRES